MQPYQKVSRSVLTMHKKNQWPKKIFVFPSFCFDSFPQMNWSSSLWEFGSMPFINFNDLFVGN